MSSSRSSPSRAVPSGVPTSSVERLTAHFNGINIGSPGFVGGFRNFATHKNAPGKNTGEKPLPAMPPSLGTRATSDPAAAVPGSLQPGYGRRTEGHGNTLSSSEFHEPPPRPPDMQPMMPMPMTMPMPMPMPSTPSSLVYQSLTMTHARSAPPTSNNNAILSYIPQPDDGRVTHFQNSSSSSIPAASPSPTIIRARAASSPPSPTSTTGSTASSSTTQCGGITKAGKRCTRVVKGPPPLSFFAPTTSEPVPRFCFQHVKEILAQSGFYSRKERAGWVEFSDWIPTYLHPDTQAALRAEMEKPASKADEPGYIYAYEIRDDRALNERRIKVGRAVKLAKRLDQWAKQCTSKEVILRGWWPGRVEDDDETNGSSLLRGKVIAGEKGPFCHRLERLVHLELADLAIHAPYLEPGFPKVGKKEKDTKINGAASVPSSPGRSPKPAKMRMPGGKPCKDCGSMHREIFTFMRAPKGKYRDMEWELIVKPVIARWGDYVGRYV